jgi:hypothetical protein
MAMVMMNRSELGGYKRRLSTKSTQQKPGHGRKVLPDPYSTWLPEMRIQTLHGRLAASKTYAKHMQNQKKMPISSLFQQNFVRVSPDAAFAALLRDIHEAQSLLHAAFAARLALPAFHAFARLESLLLARCTPKTILAHVGVTGVVGCRKRRQGRGCG